jgi:L-ribulokinase
VNRLSSDATEYVVGVDFGTLSGRAVVVRVRDGEELADAVLEYPHGVLEDALPDGTRLGADWALQVPDDYRQVLRVAVPKALHEAGVDPQRVVGIATDFTACTMVPTLADGTPLNEVRGLEGRAHAYAKLWKHHAAQPQADRLNRVAADRAEPWLPRYGGLISSEWEFAKGLQIFEEDREVYDRMSRFVEAADWIVWQLCGSYVRNACAAGYKGILQDGRYPSTEKGSVASSGTSSSSRSGSSVNRRVGSPPRRRGGPVCPRASLWPSATSTPTSRRPPSGPSSPVRWSPSWAPRPARS